MAGGHQRDCLWRGSGCATTPDATTAPIWHARPFSRERRSYILQASESSGKITLTVAQLEAFSLPSGPHLLVATLPNVWGYPPAPRAKPPGALFWTVRSGQSFGSIADRTGINIATLEALNPRLRPAALQTGDRVRLRQ